MNELQEIEIKGQRVLTTKQLAEAYGTQTERIKLNYRNNKERYVIGKHLIPIAGQELREFKTRYQNDTSFKQAKILYLWTEKGALLHAKSINTDKAWEVYDYLVDYYFRQQDLQKQEVKSAPVLRKQEQTVVDIPENVAAQKIIKSIRNTIGGIEELLELCDIYESQEDYEKKIYVLKQFGFNVSYQTLELGRIKPNMIVKAL